MFLAFLTSNVTSKFQFELNCPTKFGGARSFCFYKIFVRALLMLQNFILNIISDLFELYITFLFNVSYFPDFLSFCIHIHAAGLWIEYVLVYTLLLFIPSENPNAPEASKKRYSQGETLEFSGRVLVHLLADPAIIQKTGRILLTSDLAREYGLTDEDGTIPGDPRNLKGALAMRGYSTLASFVPGFLRIPVYLFYMMGYKFWCAFSASFTSL